MTIGEVARRSGLPSSTLRFYEKEKLICRPRRVSGRRDYDEEVFANLQLIRKALEGGFTISQARTLIHGLSGTSSPSQRWRALASQKLKEVRMRMAQLEHAEKLLERATDANVSRSAIVPIFSCRESTCFRTDERRRLSPLGSGWSPTRTYTRFGITSGLAVIRQLGDEDRITFSGASIAGSRGAKDGWSQHNM